MDSEPPCLLVLCGISSIEKELAKSLKNNNTLKLSGNAKVSVNLHSDTETPFEGDCFRINSFMNLLSTTRFGHLLIWSPLLSSTHDLISNNFCALPIGAVCVADVQFQGQGTSKNIWESPTGCLLFSFTIHNQMVDFQAVALLQFVVSLAMTEAIKDVCDKNGVPHLDVRIKWPSDLYINGLKVGGILCTSTYYSKKFSVSAGIGLNVDNEKPTTCLNAALQKMTSVAYQLQREDILAAFFNKFENLFDIFINEDASITMGSTCNLDQSEEGFRPLEELFYKTWLHSGQRVIVQEKNEDRLVENEVTIQGLTSWGYLLAIGEDGQMCELHPDGNRWPKRVESDSLWRNPKSLYSVFQLSGSRG
ncbi:hypothetical protein F0562_028151 [Nyssa sinensis]|uniref:BPL/LPL catalytic domain-containing protein n=1 Tax=Nyssa sinensis TaxID=561372 RepID=A0A5J5B5P3_9ASTE|nr:hypothetical protein F0562_028151 [Nyssa sinensis]